MNSRMLTATGRPYVRVEIKGSTAIISGIVFHEKQKKQVNSTVKKFDGVDSIRNYLCVISPFRPLEKFITQRRPSDDAEEDVLVTITNNTQQNAASSQVIYHDTLHRAHHFFNNQNKLHSISK